MIFLHFLNSFQGTMFRARKIAIDFAVFVFLGILQHTLKLLCNFDPVFETAPVTWGTVLAHPKQTRILRERGRKKSKPKGRVRFFPARRGENLSFRLIFLYLPAPFTV